MHLMAFDFLSYFSQQNLGLRFAPSAQASEQSKGVSVDGRFEELILEEDPDLLESLVFRPRSDRRGFFVSSNIDETGVLKQARILGKYVKVKTSTS